LEDIFHHFPFKSNGFHFTNNNNNYEERVIESNRERIRDNTPQPLREPNQFFFFTTEKEKYRKKKKIIRI
jgi:hypothetical protein